MRVRKMVLAAVGAGLLYPIAAWSMGSSSGTGPINEQVFATLSGNAIRTERPGWEERLELPLGCMGSPAVSVDVSVMLSRDSGPVRFRVVASDPFDRAPQIVLPPGVVTFRSGRTPDSASFTFAGEVPNAGPPFESNLSIQWRKAGSRPGKLARASAVALIQSQESCA